MHPLCCWLNTKCHKFHYRKRLQIVFSYYNKDDVYAVCVLCYRLIRLSPTSDSRRRTNRRLERPNSIYANLCSTIAPSPEANALPQMKMTAKRTHWGLCPLSEGKLISSKNFFNKIIRIFSSFGIFFFLPFSNIQFPAKSLHPKLCSDTFFVACLNKKWTEK